MDETVGDRIAADALGAVREYLAVLPEFGIHPRNAVLFGSFARGEQHEWSDIDVVVIAPEFDESQEVALRNALWRARLRADYRVQPIACGVYEWDHNETRPIIDIARREGIEIAA